MPLVTTPAMLADALGVALAVKAEATSKVDLLKTDIVVLAAEQSINVFEGDLFRATVSNVTRNLVDYKAVLAQLIEHHPTLETMINNIVKANTSTVEGMPVVRCTARK